MPFLDWTTIPQSTQIANATMPRMICLWKGRQLPNGRPSQNCWHCYNKYNTKIQTLECTLNQVFANCSKEEEVFPLTTQEIADAQRTDSKFKHCFKCSMILDKGLSVSLVENTYVVCKEGKMIILKPLHWYAVLWFHHYLQHPGHTRLEETMNARMYRKGVRTSNQSMIKSCKSC